jgi:hypothetical protein
MTVNLVIWKWGDDYSTPNSRRKVKLKTSDVAAALVGDEEHVATGEFDQQELIRQIESLYPQAPENRPFVIEQYNRHVVVNIPLQSRFDVVPKIGQLAMKLGLNGSEA